MTSESASSPEFVPQSAPAAPVAHSGSDRLWSVLCHLSYFFGAALLSFVFPLTVYLIMRSESTYVAHHAREALNFHLSILLYLICCVPFCFLVIGFPMLGLVALTGVVCTIVAAVKASKDDLYEYPLTIRFVR